MKLGKAIVNRNGLTIMPVGTRLTPMYIDRIRKWKIERLEIIKESVHEAEIAHKKKATARFKTNSDTLSDQETAALSAASDNANSAPTTVQPGKQPDLDFVRSVASAISPAFANVKQNPLMMQLRTIVIKRLVMHGPEGLLNVMRNSGKTPEKGPTNAS